MSAASCSHRFATKLFDIDEKLNIVPQLALSHEISDDGQEVTIKLRPGVKSTMASRSMRRPRNFRWSDT
jgi:ABC-type transport system substrate-binding protein